MVIGSAITEMAMIIRPLKWTVVESEGFEMARTANGTYMIEYRSTHFELSLLLHNTISIMKHNHKKLEKLREIAEKHHITTIQRFLDEKVAQEFGLVGEYKEEKTLDNETKSDYVTAE